MWFKNPFEQKLPTNSHVREKIIFDRNKKFIDPADDGWRKVGGGGWERDILGTYELMGVISPKGSLSDDHIEALYHRRRELEERIQKGNKEATLELEKTKNYIYNLERYGPEVMGGIK